jgi:maltose alpha-D-glucosyltransferase/alpha-amylase
MLQGEQSNSSVLYGDRLILKLFRRPEWGINPDVEVTTYLTERAGFRHVPPVAGTIEYRRPGEPIRSLAVVQGFVPNRGVAWQFTLDHLSRFFARVLDQPAGAAADPALAAPIGLLARAERSVPEAVGGAIGSFLADAELLGRRTGELHLALAGETVDEDFVPEPYTESCQHAWQSSVGNLTAKTFELLRARLAHLAAEVQTRARRLLGLEAAIQERFAVLTRGHNTGLRIRVHGDYHLGQLLYTGADFVIIDFEGEPARPLAQRRGKSSPLRDVAGMLRSFDYAAHSALATLRSQGAGGDPTAAGRWARIWNAWTGAAFLASYLRTVAGAALLPKSPGELQMQLDALLLEKAVYELQYELNNRPGWVPIPLAALLELADPSASL